MALDDELALAFAIIAANALGFDPDATGLPAAAFLKASFAVSLGAGFLAAGPEAVGRMGKVFFVVDFEVVAFEARGAS